MKTGAAGGTPKLRRRSASQSTSSAVHSSEPDLPPATVRNRTQDLPLPLATSDLRGREQRDSSSGNLSLPSRKFSLLILLIRMSILCGKMLLVVNPQLFTGGKAAVVPIDQHYRSLAPRCRAKHGPRGNTA